jgi:hypothetical protein
MLLRLLELFSERDYYGLGDRRTSFLKAEGRFVHMQQIGGPLGVSTITRPIFPAGQSCDLDVLNAAEHEFQQLEPQSRLPG